MSGLFTPSPGLLPPLSGLFTLSPGLLPPLSGLFTPSPGLFPPLSGLFTPSPGLLPPLSGLFPLSSGFWLLFDFSTTFNIVFISADSVPYLSTALYVIVYSPGTFTS